MAVGVSHHIVPRGTECGRIGILVDDSVETFVGAGTGRVVLVAAFSADGDGLLLPPDHLVGAADGAHRAGLVLLAPKARTIERGNPGEGRIDFFLPAAAIVPILGTVGEIELCRRSAVVLHGTELTRPG